MNIQYNLKGLEIGNVIITTKKQLNQEKITINITPKEVYDLFIKAIKEGKIIFNNPKDKEE